MKVVKREKSTSTRGHYVTNGVLLPAVLEAKEMNKVTDKLIGMIWLIAERYSRKSNFGGYSFREDMVSAAVANLCNNALKFNPEKSSNPFSFYTTAIHNSFLQYMADEKKHRTVRDLLLIESGANPSYNFGGDSDNKIVESDSSGFNPAPVGLDEDNETVDRLKALAQLALDGIDSTAPKKVTYRYQGRQPGEVKVLVAGVDYVQDEDGNIRFMDNSETMNLEAPVPKKVRVKKVKAAVIPKTPRKKKVVEPTPVVEHVDELEIA